MSGRKIHPAADVWPMLGSDELRALADDIEANGLNEPIVVDGQGRIIDGRNRAKACEIAKVEPRYRVHDGDPHDLIVSANRHRRHMTTGALAAATALVLADAGRRENGRWKRGSVGNGDSSTNWVKAMTEAGVILDHDPILLHAIATGAEALNAVYERVKADQAEAERQRRQLDTLRQKAPALAKQVEAGEMPLDEAVVIDEHRRRDEIEAERYRLEALRASCRTVWQFVSLAATLNTADFRALYAESGQPHLTHDELVDAIRTLTDIAHQWEAKAA